MTRKCGAVIAGLLVVSMAVLLVSGIMGYHLSQVSAKLASIPPTIVIDAGHGGEDGGAISVYGTRESAINLSISQKLEQMFALCGFRTYMVRTDDTAIYTSSADTLSEKKTSDLKERVRICNSIPGAVLVSIHQNHFGESQYSGAQVFYANTNQSKMFAEIAQESLRSALDPTNRRACAPANSVYLLNHISCTGILVECGFLSNPTEAKLLQNEVYQTKISCTLVGAMAQFLERGEYPSEV